MKETSFKESDSLINATNAESWNEGNSETEMTIVNSTSLIVPPYLDRLKTRLEKKLLPDKPYEHHEIFVKEIKSSWSKCVEGIIETGYILSEAKKRLSKDDYQRFRNTINFSTRTIDRLLKINDDYRIKTHVSRLPPSWGTLYELTTLDDETFEVAVQEEKIHPDMKRSDVSRLKKEPENIRGQEHNQESQRFKDKLKACIVYIDEDMYTEVDNILSKIKNIQGVTLDESPIDRYEKDTQNRMQKEFTRAQRAGRRKAIEVILQYKRSQIKAVGKEQYLKGCLEIEELLSQHSIRDLVRDPYSHDGTNLIDSVLSSIGHDKKCFDYEH